MLSPPGKVRAMFWTRQGKHWVTCLRKSWLRGDPQGVVKSRVNNSTLYLLKIYVQYFFLHDISQLCVSLECRGSARVIYWSRVRIATAGTVLRERLLTLTTSTALPTTAETHLHVLTADSNPSRLGIPSSQDLQLPVSEAPSHDVFPNPPFNLL